MGWIVFESWAHHLITDPLVLGIVSWVGTAATIIGFVIAIVQLSRVRKASEAARIASAATAKALRAKEQSGRLTHALSQLRSAKAYIYHSQVDAAAAYLEVGWSSLLEAKALALRLEDQELLAEFLTALRQVLDAIDNSRGQGLDADEVRAYSSKLQFALSGAEEMSARLHFATDAVDHSNG